MQAVAKELPKLGVARGGGPRLLDDSPARGRQLHGAAIDTYDDHRMAMSFAVAGLRVPGVVINNPGCVAKTFPDFWQRWAGAFGLRIAAMTGEEFQRVGVAGALANAYAQDTRGFLPLLALCCPARCRTRRRSSARAACSRARSRSARSP